jgi:hypothetical protein
MRHVYLKCGRKCFVYEEKGRKVYKKQVKEKGPPTSNNPISLFFVLLSLDTQQLE